jgi:TorA maturation chaperone TorD
MEYIEMAEMALNRSNIYAFLSRIYQKEVDRELLNQIRNSEFLEVLSEYDVGIKELVLQDDDKLIEDLAVEYTRLFIGPGPHLAPYESVYHENDDGDWGRLWGRDTVLVKKFIESSGLQYRSDYTGLPDHIGVELEFMGEATKKEAETWQEGNMEGALYCLKMQKRFMDEHMIKWIPLYCDKLVEAAVLSFYREIAKLTKEFIEIESKVIDSYVSEMENKGVAG